MLCYNHGLEGQMYAQYLAFDKSWLQNHLKNFHLPYVDALTLKGWMFMNQNFRSRRNRRSTDFYRFTAEDLSLAAYKPLTDSRSEFMSICKSRKVCRKLWNFWICTIIIQLSVTHWRPTLIKRRWWISTSRNPLGLWRMSTS